MIRWSDHRNNTWIILAFNILMFDIFDKGLRMIKYDTKNQADNKMVFHLSFPLF